MRQYYGVKRYGILYARKYPSAHNVEWDGVEDISATFQAKDIAEALKIIRGEKNGVPKIR